MIPGIRARRPVHHALAALAAAAVLALLAAEGSATHYLPTAVATTVSGALAVAALVVPAALFRPAAFLAALFSGTLTVVTMRLTHRPEGTFGMTELCVLLLVVVRAVREQPPLRAALSVVPVSLAAGMAPLRLNRGQYDYVLNLGEPVIFFGLVLALVLGLYLRLLDTFREREKRAGLQSQRLDHARELHDFVAHHVTAIVAQAKAARFAATAGHTPDPAELDEMFARIETSGSEAMASMRAMVSTLRNPEGAVGPPGGPPGGGLAGLRSLVATFAETGPPVEVTLDPRVTGRALPYETATAVHRLVREALTNIRKHAVDAGHIRVDVRLADGSPDRLTATVTDDGRTGGPGNAPRTEGGYGLLGLAERFEAAGGSLTAGPLPGTYGWGITGRLPLRPADSDRSPPSTGADPERRAG